MNTELTELVKKLELELLQPDVRTSINRLNNLLADDFVEIGQSGHRYTKEDILTSLPNLAEARHTMHNFQAREISPETILVTYQAEMRRGQTDQPTYSIRSSLWQRRTRGWQVIFHQGTPLSATPGITK